MTFQTDKICFNLSIKVNVWVFSFWYGNHFYSAKSKSCWLKQILWKRRKIYQVMLFTRLCWSNNRGGSQQSMPMMTLSTMTLLIPLTMTNKCPSLIISSCHHITIWPRTQKSHGGHFHRKKIVNVTVWHGSSMEYNRVFYEVKPLKMNNFLSSMHIWWLTLKMVGYIHIQQSSLTVCVTKPRNVTVWPLSLPIF